MSVQDNYDTTGRKQPLPKARYEAPDLWRDADKTLADLTTERDALKAEVVWLEKLTGKVAKPPASGGGGDKKLTAEQWLAEELKKQNN